MKIYIEILLRSILSFVVLLFFTRRLMGKKQLSQVTYFDYIVGITIGSIAAVISIDHTLPILNGALSLFIWASLPIIVGFFALKSLTFRRLVDGKPRILIANGQIIEKNLRKELFNIEDLTMKLREKNAFDIADVEFAILEPDGDLSVQFKPNKSTLTPSDIKLHIKSNGLPKTIIEDGKTLDKKIKELNISKSWITSKLAQQNIQDISMVFIAQIDESGNMYVDLYEKGNNVKNKPI